MKCAALVLLFFATFASAQQREFRGVILGDLIACGIGPFPIPSVTGMRTSSLSITGILPLWLAPAHDGRIFATSGDGIWQLSAQTPPRRIAATTATLAITIARDGTIYVVDESADLLRAYSESGVLIDTLPLPAGTVHSLDLGADQCTMYVGTSNSIGRVNVCNRTAFEPILTSLPAIVSFRVLPGGDFLADHDQSIDGIARYAPDGTVRWRYAQPDVSLRGLSIAPDLRSFWTSEAICAGNGRVVEFDLETGAILAGETIVAMNFPRQPVLSNGWTAALGAYGGAEATAGDIPSLSTLGIAALAALLAAFALTRLR